MKPLLAKKRLFSLLALVLGFVLLLGALPSLGKKVLAQFSAQLGMELEIEEIGGNIFNHLTFARIKGARSDKSQPVSEFAASDVRIDYSLASLLGGVDAFLARLKVEASQAKVVLDLTAGEDSRTAADNGGEVVLPAVLPALSVSDLVLTIHASDYDVTIADMSLQVDPAGSQSGQAVRLIIPVLELHVDGRKKLATSCQASLLYAADQIRLEEMIVPDKLASLQGALVWGNAGQPPSFTLQAAVSGGHLQGSGSFAAGQTSLGMELKDIDIAELARLLHFEDFAVAGKVSGSATSQFDPAQSGSLAADVKLELAQGRLFGETTEANLQATIQDGVLQVSEFAATHGENQMEMAGGTAPLTLFTDWDPALLGGLEINAIKLHLQNIPALMAAFGMAAPLPAVPDHVLDAQGSMADQVLNIARADFKTSRNSATLRAARLQFPPAGQSFLDSPVAGVLHLDINDLQELSSLFALPLMAGEARGDADISGTLRNPAGNITLEGKKLAYERCGLGDLKVEARADSKQLRIASMVLRNGPDTLETAGSYFFQTGRSEEISGKVFIEDVARYADSCLAMERKLAGRLQAAVSTTAAGELRLDLTMSDAAFAGFHDAVLSGVMTTDWRSYTITDAELKTEQGNLRFAAQIMPQTEEKLVRAELGQLILSYSSAEFTLDRPAPLVLSYGDKGASLDVGEMLLKSVVGDISLQGSLAWQEESLLQVQATRLTSRGWLDGLTGKEYQISGADILFTLHGPLASPRAALAAHIAEIGCPQLTVPLSGDVAVDYEGASGLSIRKFLLATPHGQQISLAGLIPYDPMADNPFLPTALDLKGKVVLPDLQGIAANTAVNAVQEGEFFGEFQLGGSWEQPTGELSFKGGNLYLHRFVKNAPKEPLTAHGLINVLPGTLRLQHLTVQGSPFAFNMDGTWSDIPSLAGLIRQPPEGLPGTVAFDGRLDMKDVGWLAPYAGGLRRLSGHLAATMSARGPAALPQFSGAATLTSGSVRLENATLPAIEKLELQAALDNDIVNLQNLTGVFGGAPFQASGAIAITGADAPVINCQLQGKNLLFYRDESMKIRADADLTAKGPWRRLKLGGKVIIVDGRYTKNVDFLTMFRGSSRPKSDRGMQLFSLTETPWRDMVFDVRITSDTPFAIYNNMARGAVRPNLRLSGTGEIPVLTGRIFVDPTRISVPAGKIVIESGVVSFPENDPDRPTFDLSGQSRLAGYDITLIFQGNSEEPVITLSSDPPLAEDELLLLVLTGTPPQSAQDKQKRAMANMNMAVYLGRGLLSKWFGSESVESEESVLDRFEIDIGRQLSKSGEETVEAQFRLIEGLFLPGDRLLLTSEKDIYDNFNVGVKVVFRFK